MALRQRLSHHLSQIIYPSLPNGAAAAAACRLHLAGFSALPQQVDDDALVSTASQALEEIQAAGTMKVERQITTPQSSTVGESNRRGCPFTMHSPACHISMECMAYAVRDVVKLIRTLRRHAWEIS
jgi:hypothetical protein